MGSRVVRRLAILFLATLVLALILPPPASAVTYEDEVWIGVGDFHEVRIDHNTTRLGYLHYFVDVLSGPSVNVWLVPEEGWEQYHDPGSDTFVHYEEYSYEDTRNVFEMGFDILEEGTYFLIIESTEGANGDATRVYYQVTHGVDEETFQLDPIFPMVVCAVVLAVMFIISFNFYVRWKERPPTEEEETEEFMRMLQGEEAPFTPVEEEPFTPVEEEPFTPVEDDGSTPAGEVFVPAPMPPPTPPPTYPEEVVAESMRRLGHEGEEGEEDD
jgi:hypothetical protein